MWYITFGFQPENYKDYYVQELGLSDQKDIIRLGWNSI